MMKNIISQTRVSELFKLGKMVIDEIRRGHLSIYMNDDDAQITALAAVIEDNLKGWLGS